MVAHNLITDPYIHEPKGAASAAEGMIYVANGAGSGSWMLWPFGHGRYVHSTTGQVITTTPSKLLINGTGSGTVTNYLPREIRSAGNLWDTANNKITPIRLGDTYSVTIAIPVTAEASTPLEFRLQADAGGAGTPTSVLLDMYFPTGKATPYTMTFDFNFPVSAASQVTNGLQFFCNTDVGSVTLGAPRISIIKTGDGLL